MRRPRWPFPAVATRKCRSQGMTPARPCPIRTSRRTRVAIAFGFVAGLLLAPHPNAIASTQSQQLIDSFRNADGVVSERGYEDYEDALFGYGNDFVIATILAVRDSGATQANPPTVTIRVERVLRGDFRRGVHEVEWLPEPLFMPCPLGAEAMIARWRQTPLSGPIVGKRLILSGTTRSGVWGANVWSRFEDEPDTRRVVEDGLKRWKPHHDAWRKSVAELARTGK